MTLGAKSKIPEAQRRGRIGRTGWQSRIYGTACSPTWTLFEIAPLKRGLRSASLRSDFVARLFVPKSLSFSQ